MKLRYYVAENISCTKKKKTNRKTALSLYKYQFLVAYSSNVWLEKNVLL